MGRVEAALPPIDPYRNEGRMARSWRLQVAAWRLIRRNPTMLALSLIGLIASLMATVLVFAIAFRLSPGAHSRSYIALVGAIAAYPSTFVSVFVNVAVAYAASAAFDGERVTLREALNAAETRLGEIAKWSLIAVAVGFILNQIAQRIPGGGRVVSWLIGAAWAVGTLFVVPILALERAPAVPALRRSVAMAKRRWAEEIGGNIAIGAWTVVIVLPAIVLIAIGAAVLATNQAAGAMIVLGGLTAVLAAITLSATARQVFAVALYRHGIDAPAGGFSTWDLENPFTGKPQAKRSSSWILRIGGAILAIAFLLGIIGAIASHNRHTASQGYFHLSYPATYAPDFQAGMPVRYHRRQIGDVVAVEVDGSTVTVSFQVLQGYQQVAMSYRAYLRHSRGGPYLQLGASRRASRSGGSP